MGIEINVKPEDVDAMVRDALMKSTIGALVERAVAAATKLGQYNSPIDQAVNAFVHENTKAILDVHYKDKLVAALVAALSENLTDEWLTKTARSFAAKLVSDLKESWR